MKLLVLLLIAVTAPILVACAGLGANTEASLPQVGAGPARLSGYELDSPAGEKLGKVEEVLVDMDTGTVRYLLVSFKDPSVFDKVAMAMNSRRFIPIPWTLVTSGVRHGTLVLNAGDRELLQAPYLDGVTAVLSIKLEQQIDAYWKP
jgi:sporulation protein YlmC with PRC-barrel domain